MKALRTIAIVHLLAWSNTLSLLAGALAAKPKRRGQLISLVVSRAHGKARCPECNGFVCSGEPCNEEPGFCHQHKALRERENAARQDG